MKNRIVYIAAGVLVLGAGIYFSTRLWAQTPGQAQPSRAQTRVGVMNVGAVIKGYAKVGAYDVEIKGRVKAFEDSTKPRRDWITKAKVDVADPKFAQKDRETMQEQLVQQQRALEDEVAKFQKTMNDQQGQMMVTIYREVQEASTRYAMSKGLDMVLTYLDSTDPAEALSPRTVMGKMQQPALMPLYYDKSMDVSADILGMLNQNYKPAAPATGTPAPTAGIRP